MPKFQLIIGPDDAGETTTIEFEAKDAAHAFAHVENHDDFVRAEIWQDGHLLCKVKASPETGKIWEVNKSVIKGS